MIDKLISGLGNNPHNPYSHETGTTMDIQDKIQRNLDLQATVLNQASRTFANDNVAEYVTPAQLQEIEDVVAHYIDQALRAMLIDVDNDHNTKDSGRRWAKMMVRETFAGRFLPMPSVTEFPNVNGVDEMYVVGPIKLRSTCAHHLVPITGEVWVGMIPSKEGNLIGLSKFHRIVNHYASRPQIQEELTAQIADAIEEITQPKGLAVYVNAKHLCCGHRGVKDENSRMGTSITRGIIRTDSSARNEFLSLVKQS